MKHLLQPENSNLCGQTCVAMIAGVSLEESDRTFGTKGKTQFKQVTAALRAFGIECEDKLVRLPKDPNVELPETCIGVDWHPIPHTHWTLWYEGRFYDPSEFMKSFLEYDGRYHKEHGLVLLSYLDIRKARM